MTKYIVAKAMTFNRVYELEGDVYVEKYLDFGSVPTDDVTHILIHPDYLQEMQQNESVNGQRENV